MCRIREKVELYIFLKRKELIELIQVHLSLSNAYLDLKNVAFLKDLKTRVY